MVSLDGNSCKGSKKHYWVLGQFLRVFLPSLPALDFSEKYTLIDCYGRIAGFVCALGEWYCGPSLWQPHRGALVGGFSLGSRLGLSYDCPRCLVPSRPTLTVTKTKIKRFSEVNSDVSIYFHVHV